MTVNVPHFVYRCYDADGRLLYVGCTAHVKPRLAAHRAGSGTARASQWLHACMARYEVSGRYPNKQEGRDAEANAIMDEHPLFNVQGRRIPMWQIHGAVAEYLMRRGHISLALETTCVCYEDDGEVTVCYSHELAAEFAAEQLARAG